ncbi:hypothetical protein ACTU45_10695 [Streptomyces sp. 24-1644]
MSENAGGWWTCWGCGNSQPAYMENPRLRGGRQNDLRTETG